MQIFITVTMNPHRMAGNLYMNRYQKVQRIALLGISANIILLFSKLAAGYLSRSQAMIADGFNSAGDVFASFMTFAGNKVSSRPEDKSHPYGHGKAEYIFSMIISFSLLLVAYKTITGSISSVLGQRHFTFSWTLVGTAVFTILLKSSLFLYTRHVGKTEENLLITANSEDHRNDIFVTSGTLLGILLGTRGIYWADGVVGTGISVWIAYTGIRIFRNAYHVLMDRNMDTALEAQVMRIVGSIGGIDHVDSITAKPIGINYILIVKVSVKGSMTVSQSHSIAAKIRKDVRSLQSVKDVVVHINPV